MKYLSFSLWGDKPIYNVGAIKNAELWKEIYPNWQMVVYYDNSVPSKTIDKLIELNVMVINMTNENLYGPFWRFLAESISDAEYSIFRDTDSRLTLREKLAVDEWITSGKSLHVMRDHPAHRIPYGAHSLGILAGMWGIKSNVIPLKKMIENSELSRTTKYGTDQSFLRTIFSIFENDKVTHDEFFDKTPFPIKRDPGRFVGERMDEHDKPVGEDYKIFL
jgi:hypothetical protein